MDMKYDDGRVDIKTFETGQKYVGFVVRGLLHLSKFVFPI